MKMMMTNNELDQWDMENQHQFQLILKYYEAAMYKVAEKIKNLNGELIQTMGRNPVKKISVRLKTMDSIADKLIRKMQPNTVNSIIKNVSDIAGVRVICYYTSDVYTIAEALLKDPEVRLLHKKDYNVHPKDNGYRSLHLIVQVPVTQYDVERWTRVEVQLRTIAIDWWASLDHEIRYKHGKHLSRRIDRELGECAKLAASLDERMNSLRRESEDSR